MHSILYTTTFNKHLYGATGKNLLASFVDKDVEGDLLIAHEGDMSLPNDSRFHFYNLDGDDYLHSWLEKNKEVIPVRLGGTFEGEFENKFHERTSEWFRKIAALHQAVTMNYDKIVFLDCDVVVKQHLPASKIEEMLDGTSMFYHFGPHRLRCGSGMETGIVGFDMTKQGGELLNHVFNKYDTGEFKNYVRWDDAWMLTVAVSENPDIDTRDIVYGRRADGHVVSDGMLAEYLEHFKGIHWKKFGVKYL